jgi:hypothetical protein
MTTNMAPNRPKMQLRVRALQTVPTEKGYVDPAALDLIVRPMRPRSVLAMAPALWRALGATPVPCASIQRRDCRHRRAWQFRPGRRRATGRVRLSPCLGQLVDERKQTSAQNRLA